jgi:hypothetical protein
MSYPTPILEEQMQSERFARAQMALQSGEMAILPIDAHTWIVTSKGSQYTVCADGATSRIRKVRPLGEDTPWQEHQGLRGTVWACTCPDFAGRCQRFSLRCKHIEAVRFSETRRIFEAAQQGFPNAFSDLQDQKTEDLMNQTSTPVLEPAGQGLAVAQIGMDAPPADEVIWRLRQPLDMNRVKRRQAPGQGTVPYLEGFDVIEMANDLFRFRWSFDLLGEPRVMRWDKVVTFYDQRVRKKVPVLGEDGKPTSEVAGIVYLTGKISVELGKAVYSHADVGRCIYSGDSPEALDMAIAGAATDCLKRCFRQMGEQFGNSLYDKDIARTAGLDAEGRGGSSESAAPRNASQESAPAHPVPPKHVSTPIPAVDAQPETLQYKDGTAVEKSNVAEVNAFQAFKVAHPGQVPASREALRTWTAGANGKK